MRNNFLTAQDAKDELAERYYNIILQMIKEKYE